MRVNHFLPLAVLSFAAVLDAQSVRLNLKWVSETIDTHAVTHHFDPPAKSSGTKWQVTNVEGCTVELKETSHRESPHSVVTGNEVFGLSEDKVSVWTFDLANLLPQFIMADSFGGPHVGIFSKADTFHFKTEVVTRTLREDGTTAGTSTWSNPGNASNLWIYFDSPTADNDRLVKQVGLELQSAVLQCAVQARARRSPKVVIAAPLRELHVDAE
jgi:hypothetical protein